MDPQAWIEPDEPNADGAGPPKAGVRIQAVVCGRCGWPNACRIQSGMRTLRFMCQWCERMTTGIVDPSIKRNVIF
jgi:transcription elongation factor Elf1